MPLTDAMPFLAALCLAAGLAPLALAAAPGPEPARAEAPAAPDPEARVRGIQAALRSAQIDGWLFFDFRDSNPIAARILMMPEGTIATRRWLYFIPADGQPVRIVHAIEEGRLDHLPGTKKVYSSWVTLQNEIKAALKGKAKIAMEYSPDGAIPYIGRVDAGTIEFVKKQGVTVVSSGDLVQRFEAVWGPREKALHDQAAVTLHELVDGAWKMIARSIRSNAPIDEHTVQQFLWKGIQSRGLTADHPPNVSVNANAANPHYDVPETGSAPIRQGDLVLIDIWAKVDEPGAVYADFTLMGSVEQTVSQNYIKIWNIVRDARDAALKFVRDSAAAGRLPQGWQVDDAARQVITAAGYGPQFIHRTGHNIDEEVHGNGAHMDNLESHDDRRLMDHTCFSIEPGIYLKGQFGVRSEIDVYLEGKEAQVTGRAPQTEIVPILSLVPPA